MQAWKGPEMRGSWERIGPSERFPAVGGEDTLQGAPTGHRANCSNHSQHSLSWYCVSVAYSCVSPPQAAALSCCVDAADVAAAVSGTDAAVGCCFSSDMMDAAHYVADRTLLVQQTTLLTHHPDVWLQLKIKTSKRSSSAEITLEGRGKDWSRNRERWLLSQMKQT